MLNSFHSTGSYPVPNEKESHQYSPSPSPSPPPANQLSLNLPPKPSSFINKATAAAKGGSKRTNDNLEPIPNQGRPTKNARTDPVTPTPMANNHPPSGVNASMHAPPKPGPLDINMSTPQPLSDNDLASGRQIINSKIIIRNLQYTAPPPGGFPTPQITKPVTANMSDQAIQLAKELPDFKVWVRPWGMRFTQELHFPRTDIKKALVDFFDREPDNALSLIQPSAEKDRDSEGDGSPWNFLISGLSKKEFDLAVETRVIASKQVVLFITPFNQPIPNFVMMLVGISFDDDKIDEAQEGIATAFQRTLSTDPLIRQSLTNLIVDPAQVSIEFEAFLQGITVKHAPVPNSQLIYWCVKSSNMPSFPSIEEYNLFIASFVNMQFFAGKYGTGRTPRKFENFNCKFCKSRDHHPEKCPYPKTLGWQAPLDTAFPWTDQTKKQPRGGRGGFQNNRGRPSGRPQPS